MKNEEVKNLITSTFNDVAEKYDNNKQFVISAKKMLETINTIGIKTSDNLNILDLSSGTGNIAIELAKQYPHAKIYAVDISQKMLDKAQEKTLKENISNISYILQDVENLQFDNIQFDIITCGYGLFFYPNMDDVLKDICNRLTDNGKFIFSTFTKDSFEPYSKVFLDLLSSDYDIRPPENIEKRLLETREEIQEFLKQESNIQYTINEIQIRYPMDIKQWWELLNTTGYQGLLTKLGNNYEKFQSKYLNTLEEMTKEGKIDFNADSFISIVSKI